MLLQKLKRYLSHAIVASFSTVLILSSNSYAQQVTLGDFSGNLTTKLSSILLMGFKVKK